VTLGELEEETKNIGKRLEWRDRDAWLHLCLTLVTDFSICDHEYKAQMIHGVIDFQIYIDQAEKE